MLSMSALYVHYKVVMQLTCFLTSLSRLFPTFLGFSRLYVMTLAKAQVAILGKGLRRSKGLVQLVKHRDIE